MGLEVLCTYSKMLFQEHFKLDPKLEVKVRDAVILNTRRGLEVGFIAAEPGSTRPSQNEASSGKVIRKASPDEMQRLQASRIRPQVPEPLRIARNLARDLQLSMRFIDLEETIDRQKYILYFSAESRVDFRELVRKIAASSNRKVELRQIGARDVARLTGDVGSCGEELCCKNFLVDFVPVNMRMAKNQGLPLDNNRVSGMCGKLKCCLKYEDELYTDFRKSLPKTGQPVQVNGEEGWVMGLNILTQMVSVRFKDRREEVDAQDLTFDPKMSDKAIRAWQRKMREEQKEAFERRQEERRNRQERRSSRSQRHQGPDRRKEKRSPTQSSEPAQKTDKAGSDQKQAPVNDEQKERRKPKNRRRSRRRKNQERREEKGGSSPASAKEDT